MPPGVRPGEPEAALTGAVKLKGGAMEAASGASLAVVVAAGIVTDGSRLTTPFCALNTIVSGAGAGFSTASVALKEAPAITPAAGNVERRRLNRSAVSAEDRPDAAVP